MNHEKINKILIGMPKKSVTALDFMDSGLPSCTIDAFNGSFDAAIKFLKMAKGKWRFMIDTEEDGCEVSVYKYNHNRRDDEITEFSGLFDLPPHQALLLAAIPAYMEGRKQ